jgi:hypothetical protein
MASKYPTFNLARFAAEILAEGRAEGRAEAPFVVTDPHASVKREIDRGSFVPTYCLMPTASQHRQYELAQRFLGVGSTHGFLKVRFEGVAVVLLQHLDGSIYRVYLRLDGPYDIERNGSPIMLKSDKWEHVMCPLEWLRLHL